MDITTLRMIDPKNLQRLARHKQDELAFYNIVYGQVVSALAPFEGHEITRHFAVHLNSTEFFKACKIEYSDNIFFKMIITDLKGRSFSFTLGFRNNPIFSIKRFKKICDNYRRYHFVEPQADEAAIIETCNEWNNTVQTLTQLYEKLNQMELADCLTEGEK